MSLRVKSLTAIFLAVFYGTVGFTGQTLHYVVEDVCLALRQIDLSESGGYFHAHNPDNHVHFHHHHQGDALASEASQSASQAASGDFRQDEQAPHLHACPLLTVVSQIQLGFAVVTTIEAAKSDTFALSQDYLVSLPLEPTSVFQARGPPLGVA